MSNARSSAPGIRSGRSSSGDAQRADAPIAEDTVDTVTGTMDRRELMAHLVQVGAGALAVAMGGGAVATLASSYIQPAEAAVPTKRRYRYGMVVDTRRCVGCKACVVACKAEHKTPPGVSYNFVSESALGSQPNDKPIFMTNPCMHCENPPCVPVCPAGATFKRPSDGIVVVDYDRCVGALCCIKACPYGARHLDTGQNYPMVVAKTAFAQAPGPEYGQYRRRDKKDDSPIGKVRKCTFCLHLQDKEGRYDRTAGRWPACAKTCTGHAIHFGDFNDPASEVSVLLRENKGRVVRLKEKLKTNPNVYYLV